MCATFSAFRPHTHVMMFSTDLLYFKYIGNECTEQWNREVYDTMMMTHSHETGI